MNIVPNLLECRTPQSTIIVGAALSSVPFGWERQYELAGLYSRFYKGVSDALAVKLAKRFELHPGAAAVLAREAVVPLGYLYLDRLLRLDALLASDPAALWAVAETPPRFPFPSRVERLQVLANTSDELARFITRHQARLWGIEPMPGPEIFVPPPPVRVVNRNFNPSTFAQKVARVFRIAYRRLTGPSRPLPVLSMGYSTDAFKNAGFYSTWFVGISGKTELLDAAPDAEIRKWLVGALSEAVRQPMDEFLQAAGFPRSKDLKLEVADQFVEFAVQAYPSSILEGARENVVRGAEVLKRHSPGPLIVGERGDLESAVLIAAAKTIAMTSIDIQHGGHIGYLADQTVTLEMEEYICDRFISWGWSRYPDYPPHPAPPLDPLPNPWLSERKKYWARHVAARREKSMPYDFVLFSNRIHRYPTAPSGAYQLTLEYLEAQGKSLVELVRESKARDFSILHKPYSKATVALMPETLAEMARAGGDRYVCVDEIQKGLSPELIAKARFVLWDQPGTGFLECLTAGIPTMCYWPRIYNREEPGAARQFAELSKVGIVHDSAQSLLEAASRSRLDGLDVWMRLPSRKEVVNRFVQNYARVDDSWSSAWTAYLREIQSPR